MRLSVLEMILTENKFTVPLLWYSRLGKFLSYRHDVHCPGFPEFGNSMAFMKLWLCNCARTQQMTECRRWILQSEAETALGC